MAKSPDDATLTMIKNLAEKTGKTLEQWLAIAKKSKLAKHGEIVSFLKADHGLGHGYANLIAHKLNASSAIDADAGDLVAEQYAGKKAGLKPIYDLLIAAVRKFGSDVEVAPKKTYVSLRRNKQFAIFQPSTADRLDVGINLKGATPTTRLEAAGSFNAMVSHRVRVSDVAQVDKDLLGWLKAAYDAS